MEPNTNNSEVSPSVPATTLTAEQEKFIGKVSWGSLIFGPVFFFATHLIKYGFLMFVPFVNIYIYVKGFFRARRLSWATGEWKDFAQYEKRHKLMDKIAKWFIVIWLILFLGAGALIFNSVKSDIMGLTSPHESAKTFLNLLREGKVDVAYDSSSEEFKSIGTVEYFSSYVGEILLGGEEPVLNQQSIVNKKAVVCGSIKDKEGNEQPVKVMLEKKIINYNNVWKVAGLDLSDTFTCEVEEVNTETGEAKNDQGNDSEVVVQDEVAATIASKEQIVLVDAIIKELLVKKDTLLYKSFDPAAIEDVSEVELLSFVMDLTNKFDGVAYVDKSVVTRPSSQGDFVGYSFEKKLVYKDNSIKYIKFYTVKKDKKVYVSNIVELEK